MSNQRETNRPRRAATVTGRLRLRHGQALAALVVVGALAVSACGSSGASTAAPSAATSSSTSFDAATLARLQQVVRQFKDTNHTPGVLVGIWSPKGTFVTASGVADLATGAPLRTDMQFKIASQTKTFTADLILQLVSEHKLSLDDHISRWVSGVPNGDEITIRELLNHTSGLADGFTSPTVQSKVVSGCTVSELLTAEAKFAPGRATRTEVVLQQLRLQPPRAGGGAGDRPGSEHGAPAAHRNPLGLHRTLLPTSGNGLTPPFTHGYGTGSVGPTSPAKAADDATDLPGSCLWAHGGMVSTLSDMHVWAKAVATGSLLDPAVQTSGDEGRDPLCFRGNYNGPGKLALRARICRVRRVQGRRGKLRRIRVGLHVLAQARHDDRGRVHQAG